MHQLQLIIGNWQSDEKAAAQARYLTALLLCSLLLIGFSAGVFGWRPLVLALIAGVAGSAVELVFSCVRKKPVTGGAFVYGLALSLLVPPTMPWWIILLAAIAGTVFAKEVFGGAKNAIFNPALIGAAMILFSYPASTAGASMGNLNAIEGGVAWENGIWMLLGCLAIQILAAPSSLFIYVPMVIFPWLLATYVIPDQKLPLEGNLQLIFSEDCFLLAGVLLATGLVIGYQGVLKILKPEELEAPGLLALFAAVLSIGVKEAMYQYTRKAAKQIDSDALMADAWHHRSDALSSVGALIGIGGARLGFPVLDPVASLCICLFIAKAACEIFRDAVNKMVDESADEETENDLRACALAHPGVLGIDRLMTRKFGSRMYVEMEISVDGEISLTAAHEIAEGVHGDIEQQFPRVKHIMIHVNPAGEIQHPPAGSGN